MQYQTRPTRVPPNPRHSRQVFWQIWLPLILAALVILTAAVLVVVTSSSGTLITAQLASISIIWMITPMIIAGMIFLLVTAGLIFVAAYVLRIVPVYTRLVQVWVQIFGLRIENILNTLAGPVIRSRASVAGWKAFWKHFLRR